MNSSEKLCKINFNNEKEKNILLMNVCLVTIFSFSIFSQRNNLAKNFHAKHQHQENLSH